MLCLGIMSESFSKQDFRLLMKAIQRVTTAKKQHDPMVFVQPHWALTLTIPCSYGEWWDDTKGLKTCPQNSTTCYFGPLHQVNPAVPCFCLMMFMMSLEAFQTSYSIERLGFLRSQWHFSIPAVKQ